MIWYSELFKNVIFPMALDALEGPYVPPCERDPYYEDPRDVKPDAEIDLQQCMECGCFFQPYISFDVGSRIYCKDCLEEKRKIVYKA